MRTVTSDSGRVETVTVRRSESADAPGIDGLVCASTRAVFGRVNIFLYYLYSYSCMYILL
uniref:Uncharacterized protein n=1 Tax=Mastacembelus armatus TaxID=205130 RepID=A0A3Q3LUS6_9TELE